MRAVRPDDFRAPLKSGQAAVGFGYVTDAGTFAAGELIGEDAGRWLHIGAENAHRHFVAPGFSGAPLFDPQSRAVVGMAVAVDTGQGVRVAYAIPAPLLQQAFPPLARPYQGLNAFDATTRVYFHGRDTYIAEICGKLAEKPLVAVIGPSGSGKCSVVKAGILPRLEEEGSTLVLSIRPLSRPWRQLARALAAQLYPRADLGERLEQADEIEARLIAKPGYLTDRLSALLSDSPWERLGDVRLGPYQVSSIAP